MPLPITLPTAISAFCARVACRLRRAAAEGDDRQADDQWTHLQACRQADGGSHQQLGAGDQQQQAAGQFEQAEQGQGSQ
jgi:hypothetical protein